MSQGQRKRRSIAVSLSDRALCGSHVKQQPWLGNFSCEGHLTGTVLVHPNGVGTPPFAIEYSQVLQHRKYLAVADEEGYVSVLDTSAPPPRGLHDEGSTPAQWLAHHNAIFDLAWCKDDRRILTASGDQTLAVWDTSRAACLGVFKGHQGSVKCVRPKPDCPDVFASGARDGALMVWDSRDVARWDGDRRVGINSPVMVMEDAHKYVSTESARKRRKQVESKQSVTSAQFLHDGQVLASAGAGDGKVKFWDLRKTDKPSWQLNAPSPGVIPLGPAQALTPTPRTKNKIQPLLEVASMSKSKHPHGITSLALDPLGSRLLVSVGNSVHYLYDTLRPGMGPTAAFTGHVTSSFFIKACFSPDGTHILSGSSDKNAYIWQVDKPYAKPYVLCGHDREVTAVAWCPTDAHSIATCGDDATVKLWSVQRPWPPAPGYAPQEEEQKENAMGLADTDWLQSSPLSTPARPHGPRSRPLADNTAAVAAAVNRENESTINDPAGCSSSVGSIARAVPGTALKGTAAQLAQPPTPFTPYSQPHALDLLAGGPSSSAAVSTTRKQQRSIRDFFTSPPLLPSAKRLKTQPQAQHASAAAHSGQHASAEQDLSCAARDSAPSASDAHGSATSASAAHDSAPSASAAHDSAPSASAAHDSVAAASATYASAAAASAAHNSAAAASAAHDSAPAASAAQRLSRQESAVEYPREQHSADSELRERYRSVTQTGSSLAAVMFSQPVLVDTQQASVLQSAPVAQVQDCHIKVQSLRQQGSGLVPFTEQSHQQQDGECVVSSQQGQQAPVAAAGAAGQQTNILCLSSAGRDGNKENMCHPVAACPVTT